jgi:very-short-patch-repair endonuclease
MAGPIEVSIPANRRARGDGLVVHRRKDLAPDLTNYRGIPLTSPVRTLIDLATRLGTRELEAAINEADKLDIIDPESLRRALGHRQGQPGTPRLRRLLDRATFSLTDSELERRFIPITRRAGLPRPLTQHRLHGFRLDFYWPHLGLVVETDGLRYHRTPAQQSRDHARDQALTAAGLTVLRFTHAQVRYEPRDVERTLASVANRLAAARSR